MRSQETVDQPEWLGANKGLASRGLGLNALGDYVSGTVAACQALSRFRCTCSQPPQLYSSRSVYDTINGL